MESVNGELLVSIVSPVYNASAFIEQTIKSVQKQSYTNWELILVDDCSSDNSASIINTLADLDSRIKYLRTEKNSGNARVPFEKGYDYAKGCFIIGMGHDDLLEENYLKKMISRQKETDADVVLSRMCPFGDDNCKCVPDQGFDMNQVLSNEDSISLTIGEWKLSLNGFFAKRDLLMQRKEYAKTYPTKNYMNSDELDGRLMLLMSNKVAFADAKYNYRIIQSSITHKVSVKLFERLFVDKQLEDIICREFGKEGDLAKNMRKTRIDAIFYWTDEFLLLKDKFSIKERGKIIKMIKSNYSSLNLRLIRKEMTSHSIKWKFAYCTCFWLFFSFRVIAMQKYL